MRDCLRGKAMTFVVTEQCIKCKYKDCVAPCPVDCFHEGPEFLVIDPERCIDCNICAIECPVNAIYQDKELPPDQVAFLEINRVLASQYPPANASMPPLLERDAWASITNKRIFLKL